MPADRSHSPWTLLRFTPLYPQQSITLNYMALGYERLTAPEDFSSNLGIHELLECLKTFSSGPLHLVGWPGNALIKKESQHRYISRSRGAIFPFSDAVLFPSGDMAIAMRNQ